MIDFGSRLKKLRKEDKLSQSKLADKLGYCRSTIANYEQNSRLPSVEILMDIADYFDVSLDYLMERTNIRSTLENTYSNKPSSIFIIINPDTGKIIDYNTAALAFFGYSKDKLLSKTIFDLSMLARETVSRELKKTLKEEKNIFHSPQRLSSGEIKDVKITTNLVIINNSPFIGALMTDITGQCEKVAVLHKKIDSFIKSISKIIRYHIPYKKHHCKNVAQLSIAIGNKLGLSPEEICGIRYAALLHDIGLLSVPPRILNKPDKLTQNEINIIKEHPTEGSQILKEVNFSRPVAEIISQHHERIDGSGYPLGLPGRKILLEAKIIAVADVVEAITSQRPHREKQSIKIALAEIKDKSGKKFDKDIVNICVDLFENKGFEFPFT